MRRSIKRGFVITKSTKTDKRTVKYMHLKLKSILTLIMLLSVTLCVHGGTWCVSAAADSGAVCTFAAACPGNIFFDGDTRRIDIKFSKQSQSAQTLNVRYEIKDFSGSIVSSQISDITLGSGEETEKTVPFYPAVSKYGVYTLSVYLTSEIGADMGSYSTEFSLCPRADYDDSDSCIGIGAHFNWTTSRNADSGAMIMKKAGIDHLREGYSWSGSETAKNGNGVFVETAANKAYLDAAQKYGLETLVMAGYGNELYMDNTRNFPVTDEERAGFANYVYGFLMRNRGRIHSVEIWNEPDNSSFNANGASGADYAKLAKAVYDRVHTDFPDVKLSAFALTYAYAENETNRQNGFKFMEDALSADLDGDGSYDLYKYIDIISVHHYLTDVSKIEQKNELLRELLNKYGCGDKEIYHTEFGFSATKARGGNEPQAEFLPKYAASLRAYNAGDRFYIYDFSNDGKDETNYEHNLGIVNSHDGQVPYSAKPSLITMANLNRVIGNCEAQSAERNGSVTTYHFKNKLGTKDAYMFFAGTGYNDAETAEIKFSANEGRTVFCDMYGNGFEPPFDGSEYTLTVSKQPIYAVVYSGDDEINAYADGGKIFVDGRFYSGTEGERVGVKVFDESGNIVYLNQFALSYDKTLKFSFPQKYKGVYRIQIGMASRGKVVEVDAEGKALAALSVYADGRAPQGVPSLNSAESVTLEAKIFDKKAENFVMLAAAYKGGSMQSVKLIDKDSMNYADGKYSAKIEKNLFADADNAEFYIFNSLSNITPLGDNIRLGS